MVITSGTFAAAIRMSYEGYKSDAPVKLETKITIPLEKSYPSANRNWALAIQPIPEWAEKAGVAKDAIVVFSLRRDHHQDLIKLGDEEAALFIAFHTTDRKVSEQSDPKFILKNIERFTIRAYFDINGDRKFHESEITSGTIKELDYYYYSSDLVAPSKSLKLTLKEFLAPDGTPMDVYIRLSNQEYGEVRLTVLPYFALPRGAYMRSTADTTLQHLIQLQIFEGKEAIVKGYRLCATARGASSQDTTAPNLRNCLPQEGSSPAEFKLSEPFWVDQKWWIITEIAPDLSSISIAESAGASSPPFRGEIGQKMPDWMNVNVVTRKLLRISDLRGRHVVLLFGSDNSHGGYASMNAFAKKIHERIPRDEIEIIKIDQNIQFDYFLGELLDAEVHYSLCKDESMLGGRSSSSRLSQIMFVPNDSQKPLTIVLDPNGTVVMRMPGTIESQMEQIEGLILH